MDPKAYLRLLTGEWRLVVELFEALKSGPIDYASAIDLIDVHKSQEADADSLLDKLLDYGIMAQPLSSETLYELGGLTEHTVSHLLQEQRLGLSESIQAHINHLDDISRALHSASEQLDQFNITDSCNKIRIQTQDIKHQVQTNLQAIRNIVAEAKKQETTKPLRQRYAEVIGAWDQYIKPMGEMIEVHGAFDTKIDGAIVRADQSSKLLENSGALISEISNVQRSRMMLNDMRSEILRNFQQARDILRPLYEVARLNSKVTRGASILIDLVQKSRFKEIEDVAVLELYRKPRTSLISKSTALMKFYYGYREIKNSPPPRIPASKSTRESKGAQSPPIDMKTILSQFKADLPISDVVKWAIEKVPDVPTNIVLDVIMLTYDENGIQAKRQEPCSNKTNSHTITGCRIEAEEINE